MDLITIALADNSLRNGVSESLLGLPAIGVSLGWGSGVAAGALVAARAATVLVLNIVLVESAG